MPAVVIGDMDLVRPLGLAGIPCIAAGPTGPETAWSRHTKGSIDLPNLWERPEEAVKCLVEFGRTAERPLALFYQKDPAVLAISRHRDELAEYYRFVVPERDVVEDLVDKRRFQARAATLGLHVPAAEFARAGLDPLPDGNLVYPLLVKPVLRSRPDETWKPVAMGAKAIVMESPSDAARVWRTPEFAGVPFVVQEYVPGGSTTLVSYHAFVAEDGTVLAEFTGRKLRTRPPELGLSTAVEITDDPRVRTVGRSVLEAFGLTGVAKVDIKIGPDGSMWILEVNPRFNLWHHPGAAAGVNIPAIVHRHLSGAPRAPSPAVTPGIRWVQVWGDWEASASAGVPRLQWLRETWSAGCRRAAHLDDPGSMLGAAAWAVKKKARARSGSGTEVADQSPM